MNQELQHRLPILRFLVEVQVLLVWATGSIILFFLLAALMTPGSLAQAASLIALVLFTPFFINFCFDIVEHTALGHPESPAFSFSILRSFPRLVRMLVYLSLVMLCIRLTPVSFEWMSMSLALAITPAVTSFVVFHQPLLSCLNPLRIWQFISNMGLTYVTVRIVTTSVLFIGLYVISGEELVVASMTALAVSAAGFTLIVLIMCRMVGVLLHQRRNELGIRTDISVEQHQAGLNQNRRREISDELIELSRLCRAEGLDVAWKRLENSMRRHGYADDGVYLELLAELSDRRLLYRFASQYIDRHLEEEVSHAWEILKNVFSESQGRFRFHSGSTLLKMTSVTQTRGERLILLQLIEDFEQTYPDHPRCREALLRGAEQALLIEERDRATQLLDRVGLLEGAIDDQLFMWCREQLES